MQTIAFANKVLRLNAIPTKYAEYDLNGESYMLGRVPFSSRSLIRSSVEISNIFEILQKILSVQSHEMLISNC
jgi:hypothetical protein